MDQVQGQTSNEPRDYEWAEFNLPAELRDGDAGSQQQAAPAAQADVDH